MAEFSARGGDEIWVRDTVNTNFMEGVLLVVSTGFAPGSIYGSTFALSTLLPSSQYGVLASYLRIRSDFLSSHLTIRSDSDLAEFSSQEI